MSKITNKPRVEFRIESDHPRGLDSSQKPQELEKFIHRIIVLKVDFDAKLPYFGQHARLDDIWQDFPFRVLNVDFQIVNDFAAVAFG